VNLSQTGGNVSVGTDAFGRSDSRNYLRRHFEVDGPAIAAAALSKLARDGKFDAQKAHKSITDPGIDPEKADPEKADPATA
jgi:pyruvate dehydrogenase E1 component